jgi:hypothetical protein
VEQSVKKASSDMIHKMLVLPLLILMGSFVMAEDTPIEPQSICPLQRQVSKHDEGIRVAVAGVQERQW